METTDWVLRYMACLQRFLIRLVCCIIRNWRNGLKPICQLDNNMQKALWLSLLFLLALSACAAPATAAPTIAPTRISATSTSAPSVGSVMVSEKDRMQLLYVP